MGPFLRSPPFQRRRPIPKNGPIRWNGLTKSRRRLEGANGLTLTNLAKILFSQKTKFSANKFKNFLSPEKKGNPKNLGKTRKSPNLAVFPAYQPTIWKISPKRRNFPQKATRRAVNSRPCGREFGSKTGYTTLFPILGSLGTPRLELWLFSLRKNGLNIPLTPLEMSQKSKNWPKITFFREIFGL